MHGRGGRMNSLQSAVCSSPHIETRIARPEAARSGHVQIQGRTQK